ncbi:lin1 family protein [Stemphylium lycopersici]|uniref:Lin1 family protein n=1 Tax=Stemphylium lycopersici TaxID=183478 RepID=A0A364N2P8_STELY|nr:lin1 family protein [Stemphylium lycopersici]RAR00174.1 lin1 family protein [Stemphylium lycopersici]RAR10308.1 lin1 family protein [Stemphylium lycopersici]
MASSSGTYNPARPKRAGEQFTRTHHMDADQPSTKKPRFDPRNPSTLAPDAEDDEDPALEADVIGKSGGIKRNAVNIDGYDSDSSTENFDARAEAQHRKEKPPKDDDDDDDDMFAEEDKDDEQDEETRRDQTNKKKLRFLDNAEIEGQEESSKSGGHVAVDFTKGPKAKTEEVESSSDEDDDEERDRVGDDVDEEIGAGGKKKHAPKLDAFNMSAEQEEGRFDEAGNFVRKAFDPDAMQDSWLEGISKKDIKKAKEAQDKLDAERKARERAEDSIVTSDVLSTLISHLDVGETPMEALVRYGKAAPKKPANNWAKKKKKAAQTMEVDVDASQEAAAAKAKQVIDSITECASRLSDRGVEDIYELPRESIMRQYKRETGEDWKNPRPETVQWEFHWLNAPEGDINGPYDQATMQAWEASGQFAAGAEFRRVGETEWSRLLDFED